ncbi:hypothetical protein NOSIN_00300 [Nocardiopsis sinuspersici]|uniref:Uncharacterized protein n=2 Tax=Nocardiopsidaceae TaxID=83676 RepID=A0A1V3BUX3_9ACTN|nr:hypothetical protein NOSIN_00300 [Nocardiopsis sinuspersici]
MMIPASLEHLGEATMVGDLLAAVDAGTHLHVRVQRGFDSAHERVQRVVVAPSTMRGLDHASALIGTWRPGVARPVLVVVRDAPLPPPPTVVDQVHALSGRVEHVMELPFLHQIRMVLHPRQALESKGRQVRRMRKALERLRGLLYADTFLAAGPPAWPEPVSTPEFVPPPVTSMALPSVPTGGTPTP